MRLDVVLSESRMGDGINVLIGEFFRYAIVGGIAFVVDFGTLVAIGEYHEEK